MCPVCPQDHSAVRTNGIAAMQRVALEALQIIPGSIWRSVSDPSSPEGV